METITRNKGFNRDKSIEELQYNAHEWKVKLEFLKVELDFLKFLISQNVFESGIINLFERLQIFKQDIDTANQKGSKLLDKTNEHSNQITNKIEFDNLQCDYFFTEIHENLEFEIEVFLEETNNLKLQLFQYIQSVVKN